MFKLLLDIWRGRKGDNALYEEFVEMLQMAWELFEEVMEVLAGRVQPDDVQDDILLRDIDINRKERQIRKDIVKRMSIAPGAHIPASLVLMSVVKDAERIGDYCKNLLEVAQLMQLPTDQLTHCHEVVDLGRHVTQIFKTSIEAFSTEDEDLASEVIEDETLMNRRCDKLIELIARSDMGANEAVCTVLWIRYLKRIEAHLSNICSSVVLPVHRLDSRLKYDKRDHSAAGRGAENDESELADDD